MTLSLPAEITHSTAEADLAHYGLDWTRRWSPKPAAIAFPRDTAQVQMLVRWALEEGVALVPSGGRTGLSGGAVAANGEVVVSTERMRGLLDFDPVGRLMRVQAGMPLQALQEAAAAHGLYYPVDFAARGSCSIGGNIATNAGGIHVLRYGTTRAWVEGLVAVDGRGERIETNRGLVKNSSGYDLRHLLIGSEGTLGIVTEAWVRLTDPPPPLRTLMFALDDFASVMPLFAALQSRLTLHAFEFLDAVALRRVLEAGAQPAFDAMPAYSVVVDCADPGDDALLAAFEHAMGEGWVSDGVVAQSAAQAAQLWRLREDITESLAPHVPYKSDVSVRVSAMPAFLADAQALLRDAYPDFEVAWFGHIGDGNLHINVLRPSDWAPADFLQACEDATDRLSALLEAHGGSISAEHGIGLVKKRWLAQTRSEEEIALMRGVRHVFDPRGILNPGKLFD